MGKNKVEMHNQRCPICGRIVEDRDLLRQGITEAIVKQMHEANNRGILATVLTFGLKIVKVVEPNLKSAFSLANEWEEVRKMLKEIANMLEMAKERINKEDLKHIEHLQNKLIEIEKGRLKNEEEWKRIVTSLHADHERLMGTPWISGSSQETQILRRLRALSPSDRFTVKQSTQGGIDIVCHIIEKRKPLGKIIIESKNTKKWNNRFVEQVEKYQQVENTPYAIISTRTLPPEALNDKIENWLFLNDIWITKDTFCEFAYLAYRKVLTEVWKQGREMEEKIQSIEKQAKVITALEEIVTTKNFNQVAQSVQQAIELSLKSDGELESLVRYISKRQKKIGNMQKKLREYLNTALDNNQRINEKLQKLLSSKAK